MTKQQRILGLIVVALMPLSFGWAGTPEQDTKVIDQFIASVEKNDQITDEQRKQVVDAVKKLRDDEFDRTLAITEGLRALYPDFRSALEAMGGEDLTPAITALSNLAKSNDTFLATEANFYLAQAYSFAERYEDAIALLEDLTIKKVDDTVQIGDATFLLGVSQSRLLQRDKAIASLTKFIDENPNAPERMKIAAWRQREQLKFLEEGSMADVFDRMDFSRRRLQLENSGKTTQTEQENIVAMLSKLIKQAEDRECNCQGEGQGEKGESKQGEGEGQGKSENGGGSKNPNGKVVRTFNDGPQSPWSQLRDRQRDPAFSAIKDKYPARYQQLIEQYYKSFER